MSETKPPIIRFCDDPCCSMFGKPMTGERRNMTTCIGVTLYDGPNPVNYFLVRIEDNTRGFRLMKSQGFLLRSQYHQALDAIKEDITRLERLIDDDKDLQYDEHEE